MPIPDYQTLMLPVLEIAAKGEKSVADAEAEIAARFRLTDEEREQLLPSGRQRLLSNRIHWAKFYLGKAGLIDLPKRGRFVASETGRSVLGRGLTSINNRFLLTFPAFRDFYKAQASASGEDEGVADESIAQVSATPEEIIEAAYENRHRALRAELLERILKNSPAFFERAIVELLVAMGYGGSRKDAAEHLGRAGDGGVDGVISEDALGLDRVYVQAKRYAPNSTIGRPQVQEFAGSLIGLGATKGIFVTTSNFSAQARDYTSRIPQRVILIDGERLSDLMISHSVGVRVQRVLEFKRIDEDFFAEE